METKRYSVFTHLSADRSADYRRVLEVFARRRRDFIIHLRPPELVRELDLDEEALDRLLDQLATWGNLDRGRDHVDAATLRDFYRVKCLYQLSERGEAAERALDLFNKSFGDPGELQAGALRDIIQYLEAILRLLQAEGEAVDHAKLLQEMNHLDARFDAFTTQAQRFMRSLQGSIELHGFTEEDFLQYKEHLIDYLQRFVHELVVSAAEVERRVREIERSGLRRAFPELARLARADALDPNDPEELAAEASARNGRWEGLRLWFLGDAAGRSQAEMLRARTREAIPALIRALQSFHDRRETGSDRRRDWLELARWFAEAPDDASAHRLWRVAFAMTPTRHLRINAETLAHRDQDPVKPRTRWVDAEPMWLQPQLRKRGRAPSAGRPPRLIDNAEERDYLRQLAAEETRQILRAHDMLVHRESVPLSSFARLDRAAFDLLLDLLGRATAEAAYTPRDEATRVHSSDGSLAIELQPPAQAGQTATLETSAGELTGPDYRVAIIPTSSPTSSPTSGVASTSTVSTPAL